MLHKKDIITVKLIQCLSQNIEFHTNFIFHPKLILNMQLSDKIVGIKFNIKLGINCDNVKEAEYIHSIHLRFKNPLYKRSENKIIDDMINYEIVNDKKGIMYRNDGVTYTDVIDNIIYTNDYKKLSTIRFTIKNDDKIYTVILNLASYTVTAIIDVNDKTDVIGIFCREIIRMYPDYFKYMKAVKSKNQKIVLYTFLDNVRQYTIKNDSIYIIDSNSKTNRVFIGGNCAYYTICTCCMKEKFENKFKELFNLN